MAKRKVTKEDLRKLEQQAEQADAKVKVVKKALGIKPKKKSFLKRLLGKN